MIGQTLSDTLEHLAEPPGFNEIDPDAPGYGLPTVWAEPHLWEHPLTRLWRARDQSRARRQQTGAQ